MSLKATVHFKIPGKTFLSGEYVALFGGPSLVLTTNPSFEVICRRGTGKHSFHAKSPAGKYIASQPEFFFQWDVEFVDPYLTGGFGASTAQFIAVCLLHIRSRDFENEKLFSLKKQIAQEVWQIYRAQFPEDSLKPSGADLVAQIVGGLTVFDSRQMTIEHLLWPFADKDILIFKTPMKIATHEHLANAPLDGAVLQTELRPSVKVAVDALKHGDWNHFLRAQQAFGQILALHHLVHSDTQLLLQKILQISGVHSARGCGALGADVIAIFIDKNEKDAIISQLKDLKFMASLQNDQAYGTIIDVIKDPA
jgi:mevalonate kinase